MLKRRDGYAGDAGHDNIQAEHLLYAGGAVIDPLCTLTTAILVHGYMPNGMMEGVVIPVIKSKSKSANDCQKLFIVELNHIYQLVPINLDSSQMLALNFVFFTLKEYLNYYHTLGSQMFVCFWMPQQHLIELNLLLFKNLVTL